MNRVLCLEDRGDTIFVEENEKYWKGVTFDYVSELVDLEYYNCKVKYINLKEIDSSEFVRDFEVIFYDLYITSQEFKEKFNSLFESYYGSFM